MNDPVSPEDTAPDIVGTLAGQAPDFGSDADATLHVYRLTPSAQPNDPHWDIAPDHGVVIVRALSPADARIVAAGSEIDFLDIEAKPGDDATTDFASAFRNEKMYHVSEEPDGRYSTVGKRGVIDQLGALTDGPPDTE
ncbi:hypothetical protein DFR52_103236 [Hoeflea marina]|uniref:Uncharacterized protein n=1 Tax=Hoeflea marina TaxID=274592 RepID=A0A317PK50_9HYPH|nr:hypothetical protein [Hoeflea marina]PWW00035.1 hypothetical protein DFR52_103236 [Hoeflea marina]